VTRPIKELKGFKRVSVAAGSCQTVTFTLFVNQLGFYNLAMEYVVEPGTIEVMIGKSSEDIQLRSQFEIIGDVTEISQARVYFSEAQIA